MIGINLNNRDRTFITEWEQSTQNKSTITVPSKISNEVLKRTIKKNKNTVTTITFDTNNQIKKIKNKQLGSTESRVIHVKI